MDRNYLSPPRISFGCCPPKVNKMEAAQHVAQMLNHLNSSRSSKPPMFDISPKVSTSPQMSTETHDGKWSPCNPARTFGYQESLMHMVSFSFDTMMHHPLARLGQNAPYGGSCWVPKMSGFANNPPAFIQPFIPTGQIEPSNNSTYEIPNQPFLSLYNYPDSQYESSMMDIYLNCKVPPKNLSLPLKKSYKLNPEAAEYIPKMTFADHQCQSLPQLIPPVSKDPTSIPPIKSHSLPQLIPPVSKDPTSIPPTKSHCTDSLTDTQQLPFPLSHYHQLDERECSILERSNYHLTEEQQSGTTDNSPSSKVKSQMASKGLDPAVAFPNHNSCIETIQKDLDLLSLSSTISDGDPRLPLSPTQCGKEEMSMPASFGAPPSCEPTVKESFKSKLGGGGLPNISLDSFAIGDDDILELLCDDDCSCSSSASSTSSDELHDSSTTSFNEEGLRDDEFGVFFQDDLPDSFLVLSQSPQEYKQQRSRTSHCITDSCSTSISDYTETDDDSDVSFLDDLPDYPLVLAQWPKKDDQQRARTTKGSTNSCSSSFTDDSDDDSDVFFLDDLADYSLVLAQGPSKDEQQRERITKCSTNSCTTSFDDSDDDAFVFFQDDLPCAAFVHPTAPGENRECISTPCNSATTNSDKIAVASNLLLTQVPDHQILRPNNCATSLHKLESASNHENSKKNVPSPSEPGSSILSYILQSASLSENSSDNEEDWPDDDSNYDCELFSLELDNSWQNPLGALVISQLCPSKNTSTVDYCSKSEKEKFQTDTNVNDVRDCWPEKIPTKVTFSDEVETHFVDYWDRCGEWEQHARDRMRFRTRIEELESILAPILDPAHRWHVFCNLENPKLC